MTSIRNRDGIKRRTRAGIGRCQGSFCMPMVTQLLTEENQIPMEQVTKKGSGSNPLFGLLFYVYPFAQSSSINAPLTDALASRERISCTFTYTGASLLATR